MDRKHLLFICVAYLIRGSFCQVADVTDPAGNTADTAFTPFTGEIPKTDPPKDALIQNTNDLKVPEAPSAIGVISGTESQSPGDAITFPDQPPVDPLTGSNPFLQIPPDPSQPPSDPTGAEISQLASDLGLDLSFLAPSDATGANALQQAVDQAFPPVVIDIPAVKVQTDQSSPSSAIAPVSSDPPISDAGSKFPKIAKDPVQPNIDSDLSLQAEIAAPGLPFPVIDGPIDPREMSQMPEVSAVPVSSSMPSSQSSLESVAFPAFEGVINPVPVDPSAASDGNPSAGGISVSLETGSTAPAFPPAIGTIAETQSFGSSSDVAAFPAFTGTIPDASSGASVSDTAAFPAFTGTIPDASSGTSVSDTAAFPAFEGTIPDASSGTSVSDTAAFPAFTGIIPDASSGASVSDTAAFPAFTGTIPDASSAASVSDAAAFPAFSATIPGAPSSPSLNDNLSTAPRSVAAATESQEATAARRQIQQEVSANPGSPNSPFPSGLPQGINPQAPEQLPGVPPFGMLPGMISDPRVQPGSTQSNTESQQQMPRLPGLPSARELPPFGIPPGMMSDPRFRFPTVPFGQPQTPQANIPNAATTQQGGQAGQSNTVGANSGPQGAFGQLPSFGMPPTMMSDRRLQQGNPQINTESQQQIPNLPGPQSAGQLPPFGMPPGMMTDRRLQQGNTQSNTESQQPMPRLPGLQPTDQMPPFGIPPGMMPDPRFGFPPMPFGRPQTPQSNTPNAATTHRSRQSGQSNTVSANSGPQAAIGQNAASLQPTRQIIDPRGAGIMPPFFPPIAGLPHVGLPDARRGQQVEQPSPIPANPQSHQATQPTSTDTSILPRAEQVLKQVQDLVDNLRSASGQQQQHDSSAAGPELCPNGRPPVTCTANPCEEVTCLNVLNARCRPRETCDGCRPSFYVIERLNDLRSERDVSDICVTVNWNQQSRGSNRRRRPTNAPPSIRGERIPEPPNMTPGRSLPSREPSVARTPDGSILLINGADTPMRPMVRPGMALPPGLRRLMAGGAVDPRILRQQMQLDPVLAEAVLTGQINPALLDPRLRGPVLRERALGFGQGPVPSGLMLPEIARQIRGENVVIPPAAQLAIQQRLQSQGRPAIPTRSGQIATVRGLRQANTGTNVGIAATRNDPRTAAARNELTQAFRQFTRQSRTRPVL